MEIVKTCTCLILCWFQGLFVNQAPIAVMEQMFTMAKSGQVKAMSTLCDPYGQNDGDTACLCALGESYSHKKCDSFNHISLKEFQEAFSKAKVFKEKVRVLKDNQIAEVPFVFFNPRTNEYREETMVMINREGKWYLLSF